MNILRLTYSGRLSFGRKKKLKDDHRVLPLTPIQEYWALVIQTHGVLEALRLHRLLGLSSVSNLQNCPEAPLKPRRGAKGISSSARVTVRDCALLLQERHGRKQLSFLTLTLPKEALVSEVLLNWSSIARKLRQWVAYRLQEAGLSGSVVGVTELQEARQATADGIPCLHWHLVFCGRRATGSWVIAPKDIDRYWQKLLSEYTGKDINVSSACQLKRVEKDASGYLGKYMSKGVKSLKGVNPELLPSSWHMISRKLLHARNKRTVYITGETAEYLWDYYSKREDLFKFGKFVELELQCGGSLTLGWYGDLLDRNTYHQVLQEINELRDIAKTL